MASNIELHCIYMHLHDGFEMTFTRLLYKGRPMVGILWGQQCIIRSVICLKLGFIFIMIDNIGRI